MFEKPSINDDHVEDPKKRTLMKAGFAAAALGALGAYGYMDFKKREAKLDNPKIETGEEIISKKIESIEKLVSDIESALGKTDNNYPEKAGIAKRTEENKKAFFKLITKHRINKTLEVAELESIEKDMLADQLRLKNPMK